jgi:hypothetical protein
MNKRFVNEILIYSKYDESKNHYYVEDCYFNDSDDDSITFNILIENKILTVKIICNTGYPFKPPNILVNNYKYRSLLRTDYLFNKYKEYLNFNKCMCCNSILCNWHVIYGFNNILNEIKTNYRLKIRLKNIIFAKNIMIKKIGFEINNLYYFL